MRTLSTLLLASTTLLLSGCIIHIGGAHAEPKVHKQQTLELSTEELASLKANVTAGFLKISGVRGQQSIQVQADIYTYDDVAAILTLKPSGQNALLVAKFDQTRFYNRSPRIDLTVTVPENLLLEINDGSGDIDINSVNADIKINDGSGDVTVRQGKQIRINDGSGSIEVTQTGAVIINDGSGDIDLARITGKVRIKDGSGDININETQGTVDINDGSGGIELTNVGGDTDINDGSGNIYAEHINGMVTIDDGSGGIKVRHTKGLNIIDSGSGSLSFKHIDGSVSVED